MEKLEARKEIIIGPDGEEFTLEHWEYEDIANKINEIIDFLNSLETDKK